MSSAYKAHNQKNSILKSTAKLFIAFLLISQIFVVISPVSSAASANNLVDTVNIGETSSEAGHDLFGWGPIVTFKNKHKGAKDDNYRSVWYNDSQNPSDIPTYSPDENWATLNLSTGEDYVATKIKINVLDGKNDESFDTYVNDNLVYSYIDDDKNHKEKWKRHNIDISNMEILGTLSVKIVATGEKPQGFDDSSQLGIGEIQLYAIKTTLVTVILKDSNNNSLSDGYVEYYYDGDWQEIGLTNESGEISKRIPDGRYNFRMTYVGASITKVQDIRINPVVEFSTINVTIKFNDSLGNPLYAGNVSCHGGSWQHFGFTNESGIVTKELLPRRYTFKMTYKGAYISKRQDIKIDPVVLFSTIEATVKLEDSSGNLLEEGNVSYYAGGWKHFGITNANGITKKEILPRAYTFRMKYDGAIVSKRQDVSVDPIVNFLTINVAVKLNDSSNNPIAGGNVSYNAGGWRGFGITDDSGTVYKEILPRAYTFRMKYDGAIVSKRQDVSVDPIVNFSTIGVAVRFEDSNGNSLSGGNIFYNSGGWKNLGTTNKTGIIYVEILPRNYRFKIQYEGAIAYITQDVSANSTIVFSTVNITVKFEDSTGNPLADGNISYYSGGWKYIGTTNSTGNITKEVLPRKYKFKMLYKGAINYITQDISLNPIVNFSTVNVAIRFEDSNSNPMAGGNISYHSGGWKYLGITNETGTINIEILPRTYVFRVKYDYTTISKRQDVSLDQLVVFSTTNVTVHFENSSGVPINNSKIYYYSGGWKELGITNDSGIVNGELLPRKYTFKLEWDNTSISKRQDINIDPNIIFNTIKVTVKLVNDNNTGLSGGVAKYYAKGWKDFGITNDDGETFNELLPRKYTFRMTYNKSSINKAQNLADDPIVIFNTTILYNKRPISRSGGPYYGFTNQSVQFNGSESYDPDGNITNYTWYPGDGTKTYGMIVNYSYVLPGEYIVKLTVTDNLGARRTHKTFAKINISQIPAVNNSTNDTDNETDDEHIPRYSTSRGPRYIVPIAVADGPYEGFIGETVLFDGSQSSDDKPIRNYTWDFGDGTKGYGEKINHSYNKIGVYDVTLTVYDTNGFYDVYYTTVDIKDVPNNIPSEPFISDKSNVSGDTYTFNLSSFDLDDDLIRFIIDWGDNTTEITDFYPSDSDITISHKWDKPGEYIIKIQADDNKTVSKTTQISVNVSSGKSPVKKQNSDFPLIIMLISISIILILCYIAYKKIIKKRKFLES